MKNLIKLLRPHYVGILLSIAVGIVIASPPYIWRFSDSYQGVDLLKTNTESHYVSQVQEIYDGHPDLGNPFLGGELKNNPYLFPPLSPHVYAFAGRLLGLSAIDAVMVLRFVFTALLSFAIYFLCFILTGRRLPGLVAAPFVMLGYALVDPSHIFDLINQVGWSQEKTFIDYGRPTNPQLSSLFFFSYVVFLLLYLKDVSKRYLGVVSTIIFGLTFYLYLYTWTFIIVINGLLFIAYSFRKDWERVKNISYITFGAILLSIPYFWHNLAVSTHALYSETSPRFGFFHTRVPEISRLTFASLLIFFASWKILSRDLRLFFLTALLATIIVVNEHIITGFYIFNHHWHWYYNTPLVIIFLSILLFEIVGHSRVKWLGRAVAAILIVVFFYNGITSQKISYDYWQPVAIDEQRYAPVLSWLRDRSPRDSVVYAPTDIMALIPAITHNNVYYHGTAIYSLVSTKQLIHAYLAKTYLDGVSTGEIEKFLNANRNSISHFIFGYTYRLKPGVCLGCFPDSLIKEMANEYIQINEGNFINYLKKYPVDYVMWDKQKFPTWRLDRFDLNEILSVNGITLYSLKNATEN